MNCMGTVRRKNYVSEESMVGRKEREGVEKTLQYHIESNRTGSKFWVLHSTLVLYA